MVAAQSLLLLYHESSCSSVVSAKRRLLDGTKVLLRNTMTESLPSTSTKSLRIVVADDEEFIREYFTRMLPRLGHHVVGVAGDGQELVDICEAEKPDLIITDIQMPELSGIEAADEISKSQSIPIIIVSSHDEPETDNPHIVGFLVKPFETAELAKAIAKAVG